MGSPEKGHQQPEGKGVFDPQALNQALARAQEAAQAREQDVAQKVVKVEELVDAYQSAAQQLEQVRQIVKTYEGLQAQRELLPAEQDALNMAQDGLKQLEAITSGSQKGMEDLFKDTGVEGRIIDQANQENRQRDEAKKKATEKEQLIAGLIERDEKLGLKVTEFLTELEQVAQVVTTTHVERANWGARLGELEEQINNLRNSLGVQHQVSELYHLNRQEWDKAKEVFTQLKSDITQAIKKNSGITKMFLRGKLESLRDSPIVSKAAVEVGKIEGLKAKVQGTFDKIEVLRNNYLTLMKEVTENTKGLSENSQELRKRNYQPKIGYTYEVTEKVDRRFKELSAQTTKEKTSDTNSRHHIDEIRRALLDQDEQGFKSTREFYSRNWT